jgi:uncharacterized protein (TIGR02757 family)
MEIENYHELENLLNEKYLYYNRPNFIENDPILIPHLFSKKEDIEISGFLASILAWGQRKTIITKCKEFLSFMDDAPLDFILNFKETDLKPFENFKHRTFNGTDALYFIEALKEIYIQFGGLEEAFSKEIKDSDDSVKNGIIGFNQIFFSLEDSPKRTTKHIASPISNSACKRINMFLRWMVRKDEFGVDIGIWNKISSNKLICPCDVHVERVARQLGLITVPKPSWKMAEELTNNLKLFDKSDPAKYDFALFGLGVEGIL